MANRGHTSQSPRPHLSNLFSPHQVYDPESPRTEAGGNPLPPRTFLSRRSTSVLHEELRTQDQIRIAYEALSHALLDKSSPLYSQDADDSVPAAPSPPNRLYTSPCGFRVIGFVSPFHEATVAMKKVIMYKPYFIALADNGYFFPV